MKFDLGELVYDPRHRKIGMVKTIKTLTVTGVHYGVHFFGDTYCAEGNVRLFAVYHADGILERYESNCSSR